MVDAGESDGARCSTGSRALGEPRAGTAPHARLWILVEQPGAWGRDAVVDSHLPRDVAASLTDIARRFPVRVGLIRAPGGHADLAPSRRTLLVSRTDRSTAWLSSRQVDDLAAVAEIDVETCLAAVSPPDALPGVADVQVQDALLVCTNARRDRCCALLGRPLAARLAAEQSPSTAVWETSHTGGHRFAPTFVSLPDGYLFGGPDAASRSLDACRGRSSLPQPAQAVELAALREMGAAVPRPLSVHATADADVWDVDADGSVLTVRVRTHAGPDRPESCGKAPVPSTWFETTVTGESEAARR